jgi:hypothetical protein
MQLPSSVVLHGLAALLHAGLGLRVAAPGLVSVPSS